MTGAPQVRIESETADAAVIAAAIAPDNTADVTTTVDDGTVVTTIQRDSTASLAATVDDYLLNVDVAQQVVQAIATNTNQSTQHHE